MLEHSYTYELVELLPGFEIAIIADIDPTPIREPCLPYSLPRHFGLWDAEGYAERFDAVVAGRMNEQAAPTATEVQQSIAGAQSEFSADVIQFLCLSGIYAVSSRFEVRAGINRRAV